MEAVEILECSREGLPGVRGAERSDGGGGNWGGPPRPGGCGEHRSEAPYNRWVAGKSVVCREGVGGGRSTGRAVGQHNRGDGKGRCFVRARVGSPGLVSAVSARSTLAAVRGDRVRGLQHVLYRAAKADPDRRFHALFDKGSRRDVVQRAWEQVRRNRGAAGVDQVTIAAVEQYGVDRLLDEVAAEVRER